MADKELQTYIMERLDRIEGKVVTLLEFKYQIIGGSVVFSAIVSLIVALVTSTAS